jgi:hypothetical protein
VTHRLFVAMGLCLALAFTLSARPVVAQEKKPAAKLNRVEGNVQSVDTAAKTVTVRVRGKTNTVAVLFSDKTLFTFRNKPGSVDEVKDGRHVICLGRFNDKSELTASRIDVRDER